jgi:hypothetical protein
VSLVAASFSLPFLLKGLELPPEPSQQEEEDRARIAAAEAAIQAIEQAQHHMSEGRSDADIYTAMPGYVSWSSIASGSMVAQRPAEKQTPRAIALMQGRSRRPPIRPAEVGAFRRRLQKGRFCGDFARIVTGLSVSVGISGL